MPLDPSQIQSFRSDGYLILDEVFSQEEVDLVRRIWRHDGQLASELKENQNYEGEGIPTRLAYRPHISDDAYGAIASCARIAGPLRDLYGASPQHYYSLNMQKDPGTGGWEYHQDYGYHYEEFLYPDFVSVMVALEPATQANGCLRVVKGSNRLGRLEHQGLGSQRIADRKRLQFALDEMEEVHCELDAGSVLLFDGNVLHASNPNRGDTGRWSLVIAYVPETNVWVREEEPQMNRFEPLDDEALRRAFDRHAAQVLPAHEVTS